MNENVLPMTLEALVHLAPPPRPRDRVAPEDYDSFRDLYSFVLRFGANGESCAVRVTRESGHMYRISLLEDDERVVYEMVRTWRNARYAVESRVRKANVAAATRALS